MSTLITVDNLALALKILNQTWPLVDAAIGYLNSTVITEADIASLKAQDVAAADAQQKAIDAALERAKARETKANS